MREDCAAGVSVASGAVRGGLPDEGRRPRALPPPRDCEGHSSPFPFSLSARSGARRCVARARALLGPAGGLGSAIRARAGIAPARDAGAPSGPSSRFADRVRRRDRAPAEHRADEGGGTCRHAAAGVLPAVAARSRGGSGLRSGNPRWPPRAHHAAGSAWADYNPSTASRATP